MVTLDQAGAAARRIRLRRSDVPWLSHIWIDQGPWAGTDWRIVPDGCAHIIYHRIGPRHSPQHRLHVVGARSMFTDVHPAQRVFTIGARLQPGALPALLDVRADELVDRTIPLARIDPRAARLMGILAGLAPETAAGALEGWIGHALRGCDPGRAIRRIATALALLGGGDSSCRAAAATVACSPRHLRNLFHTHVGLPPKRYQRIARVHRAIGLRLTGQPSWARVAILAGFADQSHLSREFTQLLGDTPCAWESRRTPAPPP